MNPLQLLILILVSCNAVLQFSSFRVATMAGISLLWGGVMAGLILGVTETSIEDSAIWQLSKILLLLESALMLVGCFIASPNPNHRLTRILKRYPGFMLWFPLLILAQQIVIRNPGVSFGLLALAGGLGTAMITLGACWGVKNIPIDPADKQHLIYLVNLSIILTIILSDGISL